MAFCKKCGCTDMVKYGKIRGMQRWQCKACGASVVEGDKQRSPEIVELERVDVKGNPFALTVIRYGFIDQAEQDARERLFFFNP